MSFQNAHFSLMGCSDLLGYFLSLNSVCCIVKITLSQTTHHTIVKPYYCGVGDIAQRER